MVETAYAAEHLLQAALANYPELLPGDQISESRSYAKTQRAIPPMPWRLLSARMKSIPELVYA